MNVFTLTVGTHAQWGTRIVTPAGTVIDEPRESFEVAAEQVRTLNETRPGMARLIMLEVVVGRWFGNVDGNSYGMCLAWPGGAAHDQVVEYHPAGSRAEAEDLVAEYEGPAEASVASRWVVPGEWQCVGSDVPF